MDNAVNNETKPEFKRCPFCGGEPKFERDTRGAAEDVQGPVYQALTCSRCQSGPPWDEEEDVPNAIEQCKARLITAWNTRVPVAVGESCTCNHVCPSRYEREIDDEVQCVHADWCALSDARTQPSPTDAISRARLQLEANALNFRSAIFWIQNDFSGATTKEEALELLTWYEKESREAARALLAIQSAPTAMPTLPYVCTACGVQQHADGICANCGSPELKSQGAPADAARRAAEEVANELFRIANGQRHVPFQRATIARAMELIITRHMAAVKVENEDAKV